MVEALCHKPEGSGMEFRWDNWIFPYLRYLPSRTMALGLTEHLTKMSTIKCFWGVERGRRWRLAISQSSVRELSRKCRILDISQPYRPEQTGENYNGFPYTSLGTLHINQTARHVTIAIILHKASLHIFRVHSHHYNGVGSEDLTDVLTTPCHSLWTPWIHQLPSKSIPPSSD
jgi:hypothetical protein